MMRVGHVNKTKYSRNIAIAVVGMLYSIYVIYASGKDAVFGGMLVWSVGFLIWAFIAFRFAQQTHVTAEAA